MNDRVGHADRLTPPRLDIRCTSSDCDNDLHCFLATRKLRSTQQEGRCRTCGADLVDWTRVKRRDLTDIANTFTSLRQEYFRHYFWHIELDTRAVNYARRKGRIRLAAATRARIASSVGPATPWRDGQQTRREGSGNPIHYAQHATATCCRRCIEEWHGIPRGRALSEPEIDYLSGLAIRYLEERVLVTEHGETVPAIRKR